MTQVGIVFLCIFWIPAILILVYKIAFILRSEKVMSEVVDIVPMYRGAKYTVNIDYDGMIEKKVVFPNTRFQTYRMGSKIELYRKSVNEQVTYKVVQSYLALPFLLMGVSSIFGFAMLVS